MVLATKKNVLLQRGQFELIGEQKAKSMRAYVRTLSRAGRAAMAEATAPAPVFAIGSHPASGNDRSIRRSQAEAHDDDS